MHMRAQISTEIMRDPKRDPCGPLWLSSSAGATGATGAVEASERHASSRWPKGQIGRSLGRRDDKARLAPGLALGLIPDPDGYLMQA